MARVQGYETQGVPYKPGMGKQQTAQRPGTETNQPAAEPAARREWQDRACENLRCVIDVQDDFARKDGASDVQAKRARFVMQRNLSALPEKTQ